MKIIPIKMSKTSKMPCHSFSLPAATCKTGAKLAKVEGSVCYGCYARKGKYNFPNVKAPRTENFDNLPQGDWTEWVEQMTATIKKKEKSGYFRWHDSGDIQSAEHLSAIVQVANNLPNIKFWLPTKEKAIIKRFANEIPENLTVRLSSAMIDQGPSKSWAVTSTVHSKEKGLQYGLECGAYQRDGKCGSCRACWSKEVFNVSYPKH